METPKERLQKEREKKEFIASLSAREDYQKTFETPSGRRVLADLLVKGHVIESTCSGNAWSYFYEGERNFILRMMALIPEIIGEELAKLMSIKQSEINKLIAENADGETEE